MENENIVIQEKEGVKYLQFRKLLEHDDKISHAFYIGKKFNFRLRNNNGTFPENIAYYKEFFNVLGLSFKNCIKTWQGHTTNVKIIESPIPLLNENDEDEDMDAIVTDKKNMVLSTISADCNLILIYDSRLNVIANVHSGWRGTLHNIVGKTVEKMTETYNSDPKDIICAICPSIHQCHFEVDSDVYELFKEKYAENSLYEKKNEKWHIDLIGVLTKNLIDIGVLKENIIDSGICTVCHKDEIHSMRGDKENYGLSISVISLK